MRGLISAIQETLHESEEKYVKELLKGRTQPGKTEKEQFAGKEYGYVEGTGKMLKTHHAKFYPDRKYTPIQEASDIAVSLSMPLFIRLLEWAKEECKTDVQIHQVAEKLSQIKNADMDSYGDMIKTTLNESADNDILGASFADFLAFVKEELNIQKMPRIEFSEDTSEVKNKKAYGCYSPMNESIWLYIKNRNLGDSMRTLAHELVHHKQNEEDRLYEGAGAAGTDIENEANSLAAIIMRKYGAENTHIYESFAH